MKIWKLRAEVDEFDNLFPVEEWSYEKMVSFDGRSHIKDWSPERVERMEPEKKLPLSDNPGFYIPDLPAFSKRAVNCLYPMIENYIELLPLKFDEGEFYAVNIVNILKKAVNYDISKMTYFSNSNKVMFFDEYAFNIDVVRDQPIFRVEEDLGSLFVSEAFVNLVTENHLTGFCFDLVWDSEAVKTYEEDPYEKRLGEKFASLAPEQQEIILTYREDPRGFLKAVGEVKNPEISEGTIFAMKLSETMYCFGKVICRNPEFSELDGDIMTVCFFDEISDTMEDVPEELSMDCLLWGPVIISTGYWKMGVCRTVGNRSLSEQEKNLRIGFFKEEGGAKEYYDVFGRKIENSTEVTEICQRWLLEDLEENLMIEMMRKNSVSCKTLREEAL